MILLEMASNDFCVDCCCCTGVNSSYVENDEAAKDG